MALLRFMVLLAKQANRAYAPRVRINVPSRNSVDTSDVI